MASLSHENIACFLFCHKNAKIRQELAYLWFYTKFKKSVLSCLSLFYWKVLVNFVENPPSLLFTLIKILLYYNKFSERSGWRNVETSARMSCYKNVWEKLHYFTGGGHFVIGQSIMCDKSQNISPTQKKDKEGSALCLLPSKVAFLLFQCLSAKS